MKISNLPRKATVIRLCMDGNTPDKNDLFYGKFVLDRVVTIVHQFENELLLTDMFVPELMDKDNDYCYHGFIVVDTHMIELLKY